MPYYNCIVCGFISKYKTRYEAHLKTKKHINNIKGIDEKHQYEDPKKKGPIQKLGPPKKKGPIWVQADTFEKKHQQLNLKNIAFYKNRCSFCGKDFSNNSHMHRHVRNACRKNPNSKISKKKKNFKSNDINYPNDILYPNDLTNNREINKKPCDHNMIDFLLEQNETLLQHLKDDQEEKKELKQKINEMNNRLTKLNPINLTNNYNDIKILNIYTMKPVDLLNKFCKNNPPSDGVIKYLEKRGIKSNEENRLLIAHNSNNIDFVASEIDRILKDCNKELIKSTNIEENTCDGILFSNDGSCRRHIVKGPTDWLYINDDKILDRAVSQILDKATLKYGIQMNYVKKIRGQIIKKIKKMNDWSSIKKKIIDQVELKENLEEDKLIFNNLDNSELKQRVENFLNDFQNNEDYNENHQDTNVIQNDDKNIPNLNNNINNIHNNHNILDPDYHSPSDYESTDSNEDKNIYNKEFYKNKIFYDPEKTYLEIIDCGNKYLMDKNNLNVFHIESKKYIGKAIHEKECPINHINNEITSKCWKYVEYI